MIKRVALYIEILTIGHVARTFEMRTQHALHLRLIMASVTKIADMKSTVNWMETIAHVLPVVLIHSKVTLNVTKNVLCRHVIWMAALVMSVLWDVGLGCFKTMSVKMNVKIENASGITTCAILQLKIIRLMCMLWESLTWMKPPEQGRRTTRIEV